MFHECDGECGDYRDKDHPIKGRWQIDEWKFSRCPLTYVSSSVYYWIYAYKLFCKGILPTEKGWLNESNKYIEIMTFIDNEVKKEETKNVK